jgi:hypothetical protein
MRPAYPASDQCQPELRTSAKTHRRNVPLARPTASQSGSRRGLPGYLVHLRVRAASGTTWWSTGKENDHDVENDQHSDGNRRESRQMTMLLTSRRARSPCSEGLPNWIHHPHPMYFFGPNHALLVRRARVPRRMPTFAVRSTIPI